MTILILVGLAFGFGMCLGWVLRTPIVPFDERGDQ
jgi:hypothetical protein